MARVDVVNRDGTRWIVVTVSRRNLLTLLHKLDMPGSARTITTENCWEDGVLAPLTAEQANESSLPRTFLLPHSEEDVEHYASRPYPPGDMHPDTEAFVRTHGGWSRREG